MMAFTHELAAGALALDTNAIPPAARQWAKLAIADNCAAAIAGAHEPAAALLFETIGQDQKTGDCGIFGRAQRLPMLDAALLNGVAAHALDFDDCSVTMDGHPSVPMVPAILAMSEARNLSGAAVVDAYIVGFETEMRIARMAHPDLVRRGWHPTSVLGVFGAAAACARLLGLGEAGFATALSIAASHAAGLRANSGTMTKPLHAGQANRHGLLAALLAARGYSANPAVFEHDLGFGNAYLGRTCGEATAREDWSSHLEILEPGIAIKQFPCCAFVHPAIVATQRAVGERPIASHDIDEVWVKLHASRIRNVDRPVPMTDLDAKFSTHYVVALALLGSPVAMADFAGQAFQRPDARALMQRVRLAPHQDALAEGRVEIRLRNGEVITAQASIDMGRGPGDPMSAEEFRAKFVGCVETAMGEPAADALLRTMLDLERTPSIRDLMAQIGRADRRCGTQTA